MSEIETTRRSENLTEGVGILLSSNGYAVTASHATMQKKPLYPWSASIGVEEAGAASDSGLEASRTMEESVVKRSICGC